MAVGATPVDDLAREVKESGIDLIVIGDAKTPRKITDAVKEGFEEGMKV